MASGWSATILQPQRSFCPSFSWSSLLPATSLANSVQARFPMLIFCSVSPRLPSPPTGVTDPAQAWQIGLDRSEEILVGIMSSLLVTSVLWPRYAREEFLEAGSAALKTVNRLVLANVQASIDAANEGSETEELHTVFDQQLTGLRNLQQAGARESTLFSARLSNYNAFLVSLTNLFHVGLYLSRHRVEPWFLDHIRQETESLLVSRNLRRVQHFNHRSFSRRKIAL